jgi:hypothetical protein
MAQALLVNIDVPLGAEVLSALDAAGLKPNVAMWAYLSDYEEWRFIIASRHLEERPLRVAYGKVIRAMDSAGIGVMRAPEVMILRMNDSFIKDLRRRFGKAASVEGMRLGGQRIGERYLEDAWVYRIA